MPLKHSGLTWRSHLKEEPHLTDNITMYTLCTRTDKQKTASSSTSDTSLTLFAHTQACLFRVYTSLWGLVLGFSSVTSHDSSNTLPPQGNMCSTAGKMRAEDHLQPAEGAVLIVTGDHCMTVHHHQPHSHLTGPCQTQSWRHAGRQRSEKKRKRNSKTDEKSQL